MKALVFQLVESTYLSTFWVSNVNLHHPYNEDFVPCTKRYAAELRSQGCEVIIALTHMREPNDDRIARECAADIDAVLGGHDHHYVAKTVEVGGGGGGDAN